MVKKRVSRWDQDPTAESAEADLLKLLVRESAVQSRLDKLKNEVQELQTERNALGKKCGKLNLFVAEKLCRKFADKFYDTLPPELRDLVYAHVWDDAMLDLVFDDVSIYAIKSGEHNLPPPPLKYPVQEKDKIKHMPWSVACTKGLCNCFRWWELPAWVQHQFVGVDIAKEAVAAYYRAMQPTRLGSKLGQLDNFLSTDHFHLGVKPADHIRRLELNLDQRYINAEIGQPSLLMRVEGLTLLGQVLASLARVRIKRGFQLSFKIVWHGPDVNNTQALELSRGVAGRLEKAGAIVKVVVWHSFLRKCYDASDYFKLSPGRWETKWNKKVRRDIHRLSKDPLRLAINPDIAGPDSVMLRAMLNQYGDDFADILAGVPHQYLHPGSPPPLPAGGFVNQDNADDDDISDDDPHTHSEASGSASSGPITDTLPWTSHMWDTNDSESMHANSDVDPPSLFSSDEDMEDDYKHDMFGEE